MRGSTFVREARRRAGLTQAQLAERVGTTQSAIARIERGGVAPTFERIVELVRACGFELDAHLVVLDDSNWILARQNARLAPSDRVRQMLAFRRLAVAVREAGIAHRESEAGQRGRAS